MKKLSIIIACFNKYKFTQSALNDLFQLPNDHEIIVVDNASTDETQKELSNIKKDNFIYIRNELNGLHSKASNLGYAFSTGNNILFLNNDIRVKSNYNNWTDNILKYCSTHIVGPTMGLLDKNLNFVKESNQDLFGNTYISGWCIASSRKNWKKFDTKNNGQIFDEETFPHYFNDTDIGFMSRKLNIQMKIVDIPVVHFGRISAEQTNIQKLYNDGRKNFIEKWNKK